MRRIRLQVSDTDYLLKLGLHFATTPTLLDFYHFYAYKNWQNPIVFLILCIHHTHPHSNTLIPIAYGIDEKGTDCNAIKHLILF